MNWWIDESLYPGPRFATYGIRITVNKLNERTYSRPIDKRATPQLPSGAGSTFWCYYKPVGKILEHERIEQFFGGQVENVYTVELYPEIDPDDAEWHGKLSIGELYEIPVLQSGEVY